MKFLADARLNQKKKFSLRAFHDYLWKNGKVAIALLRWEYFELGEELENSRRGVKLKSAAWPASVRNAQSFPIRDFRFLNLIDSAMRQSTIGSD